MASTDPSGSCRLRRVERGFETGHLITQSESALLQSAQGELVVVDGKRCAIDQVVEIAVLDAKLDQLS